MKFFTSVTKANAELTSAAAALQPVLEKAGIKSASREGKVIPIEDATIAEKFNALQSAQPSGSDLQQRSELLESNEIISKRCEKAESDLAIAQTSVGTLTREKVALETDLTAARASITTLTANQADLTNRLDAAVNQYSAEFGKVKAFNTAISKLCLEAGCLDLKALNLKADATDAEKLAAVETLPVDEKLNAYKGAVNAAVGRLGISANSLPGAPSGGANLATTGILAKLNAITNPTERAKFFKENKAAIASAANSAR